MFVSGELILVSTLISLASAASSAAISPTDLKVKQLANFGSSSWIENLAVRSSGEVLGTELLNPRIWQVDPDGRVQPIVVHSWAEGASAGKYDGVLGIAETRDDEFFVAVAGQYNESMMLLPNSTNYIFRVDFSTLKVSSTGEVLSNATVTKLTDLKGSQLVNGATTLNEDAILVSDSYNGWVYKVDVRTGVYDVIVDDPLMKKNYGAAPQGQIGVNGIKVFRGYLYWTNTDAGLLARIKINEDGKPCGASEIIASNLSGPDDFTLDENGAAYIALGTVNELGIVYPGGSNRTVAVGGPTAAKFGRQHGDHHRLYLSTHGGSNILSSGKSIYNGTISSPLFLLHSPNGWLALNVTPITMSLFHDSPIVQPKCHSGVKSRNQLNVSSTPARHRHILPKSISIPSLPSVVRSSLSWAGNTLNAYRDGASREQRKALTDVEDRKQILYLRMRNAVSYEEWRNCACELDELEDNNTWKQTFECTEYNPHLVQERLKQLEEARISCDVSRMLFLIRTSLSRDLGNMSNVALYRHSHVGTKDLIDRYITTALDTISTLVELSGKKCDALELRYMLDQLLAARQAFGRSALLFSGGATFGMNHIGVLKALYEAKMLPRIISGASAGSIVCAVFCTRTDDELPALLDTYAYGDFAVFDEEGKEENILQKTARFLKYGSFLDISQLAKVMRNWLGDITFQEAYNRTRRILNICVSSAGVYELPRLLNYITAPNVMIWSAVAVSCSVPLVFTPFVLMAKDPLTGEAVPWTDFHKQYIDGSVDGDLPMTRLSEMFNVNHFIVSQVNPHVVPFLPKDDGPSHGPTQTSSSPSWLHTVTHLAKEEILHRMTVLSDLGIFPTSLTKVASIMNQKYYGDINIYPEILYSNFPRILKNPTTEFMLQACLSGERATWPKLRQIRNHCAIELALDSAIQKMRVRVAFSPSLVDLRYHGLNGHSIESLDSSGGRGRMLNRRSSYDHEVERMERMRPNSGRPSTARVRRSHSVLFSEQSHTLSVIRSPEVGQEIHHQRDDRPSDLTVDGTYCIDSDYDQTDLSSPERPIPFQDSSWGSSAREQPGSRHGQQSPVRTRPSLSSAVSVTGSSVGASRRLSSAHSVDDASTRMSLSSKTMSPPRSLLQMTPTVQVGSTGSTTRHSYS
ncbi:hypothetical protein CFD26_100619 [Aspergillus turcosus]|uniref:PNPLA domain-containing protein n=1 Tax=Aspergillus turcosus TaxID=1245748 RepID=A0A421DFQ9_9EURO|nr:hypothetical protein CFD26_100619 [Aspergillus turcosus]